MAALGCAPVETPAEALLDAGVDASFQPPPHSSKPLDCVGPQPGAAPLRLLTRVEYAHTVRDLLGEADPPIGSLPAENHALGFENNAEAHQASPLLVQRFLGAAEVIADRAVAERLAEVAPCAAQPDADVEACRDAFIEDFGRRAFRRPLREAEAQTFREVFDAGLAEGGMVEAVSWTIQTALMSPQLLYRLIEVGPAESKSEVVRLTGWELASRLSYFLWSSTPDEGLLDAAAAGDLDTVAGVEAQARRMIDDDKARDTLASFHRQWLGLDGLDHAARDLPEWAPMDGRALTRAWKSSLLAFAEDAVFGEAGSLSALLTSPMVFVEPEMGPLYGGYTQDGPTAFDPAQRAGILTQPGLMGLLAHPEQSSPIKRGIFVRERLMCEPLPPPPSDIEITPPDPDPALTTRERFAEHTADDRCRFCHERIDPIGFGLEAYDNLGRHRTEENGLPIDDSGAVLHPLYDPAIEGVFNGAVDLAHRLATSPQVTDCVARQWYRFAMGRGAAAEADACTLQGIQEAFRASGGDVRELLVSLAISETFLSRPAAVAEETP